ncbi:hypothetical protein WN51_10633 [Melipona quadrifasciata]|uniref:Uncharacterized protein n=1 Tax=Melipona quadrifasciata TaxID=166423 RepID=A0A0M9A6J7_9HYME|nr:hypothetical protein WN51_10633 [Melipona quadrifasciata]
MKPAPRGKLNSSREGLSIRSEIAPRPQVRIFHPPSELIALEQYPDRRFETST